VFAGVPFLILRQVLAGHFRARHDRERMQGLFEATLEANRSMGADDVEVAIAGWAQRLLRSAKAELVTERPRTTGTVEPVLAAGVDSRWLVVSGRSKNEPFDSADQSLLEALTAVGAGALANARLYSEMERQQDRLATIAATLGEGVCAVDLAGRVTFVNPAAQEMLGLTDDEMVGIASGASLLRLPFLEAPAMHAMGTSSTVRDDDTIFQDRGGAALPVAFTCSPIIEDGEPTGAVIAFRDIAERKAFEQRLAHHAFHDALTGLPNRRVFLDRLDQALGRSKRSAQIHAVLFADVDRFKVINDGIGHLGGDHLLAAIADRLSSVLRPGDTLARFGGDEYTMLLEDIGGPAEAEAATARILSTLNTPIVLPSGHEVVATLSIGIALAGAGATADDVLHNADVAMYQAKAQGPGRFEMFDPRAMGARSVERVEMETALRRAIEFNEIEVHYQPVFTSDNLSIVGAEALVRWRHPTRGLLPPADFITLAEETGLILNLGTRVLETACRDAKSWFEEFGLPLTVAVNLSFRQFAQADLARQVATVLDKTGLDPSRLCLEITESVAVHDFDRTIAMLHELKDLGIHLAIDDFGTGYSSLNYLKQFPVDIVKLDRGFIAGLETSTVDSAIVAAVVALSDAIGMSIVAEGVENTAQLERLRSLGCPLVQGYLFAKPMPNAEIAGLLKLRHASDARLIDATEPRPATVDASAVLIAGL
jgi:diguanylate cyclase (GGDEF)-like protein/PAS domain S-box-containing protein